MNAGVMRVTWHYYQFTHESLRLAMIQCHSLTHRFKGLELIMSQFMTLQNTVSQSGFGQLDNPSCNASITPASYRNKQPTQKTTRANPIRISMSVIFSDPAYAELKPKRPSKQITIARLQKIRVFVKLGLQTDALSELELLG